jgi:hypothetical protein
VAGAVAVLVVAVIAVVAVVGLGRSWLLDRPYEEKLRIRVVAMQESVAPQSQRTDSTFVADAATATCPSVAEGRPSPTVRLNVSDSMLAQEPCLASADGRRSLATIITVTGVLFLIALGGGAAWRLRRRPFRRA